MATIEVEHNRRSDRSAEMSMSIRVNGAEFGRAHLADYKLPRRLVLVDQVVRSPSGKPDYPWARAQLAPDPSEPHAPNESV